jgi:hypothetical protein
MGITMRIAQFLRGNGRRLRAFGRDRRGGMLVETAMGVAFLVTLTVSVADFGLAYARQMAMSNAVRAGSQLALVRHPSLDPSADQTGALTSIGEIRQAVLNTATFLDSDPGEDALSVTLICACPDMTTINCFPESGVTPPCAERRTYVEVALQLEYALALPYPVVGENLTLRASNSVRLR